MKRRWSIPVAALALVLVAAACSKGTPAVFLTPMNLHPTACSQVPKLSPQPQVWVALGLSKRRRRESPS